MAGGSIDDIDVPGTSRVTRDVPECVLVLCGSSDLDELHLALQCQC